MSVNSYLEKLSSSLVLNGDEKSHIKTSVAKITERLGYYFSDVKDIVVFGSYSRETILPRKVDEKSDVDIMVIFDNPNLYKPQSFINRLKSFAERYYQTSEIHQSYPTVVLELNHIKFELVPTYISYGNYYIPKNPSEWMYTNPTNFNSTLLACNRNNGYKVKPVIRLIKHWNINKNNRDIASFSIEECIANNLMYAYVNCTSYTEYLKRALTEIKCLTDYSKVNIAISHIDNAVECEKNGLPYSAMLEIQKVFPEV